MTQTRKIRGQLSLMLAFVLILMTPSLINAQESTPSTSNGGSGPVKAFEFYPADTGFGSFFSPIIEAGESAELVGLIANTGSVDQEIRLYPLNAFTKDGGGFGAAPYGESPNEVTSWVKLSDEVYSIKPGTGIKKTFQVDVPNGTAPGQYITAVAAEEANASAVEGSDMFKQKLRFVVPIFITVPGPTTAGFNATDIELSTDTGMLLIRIGLENVGDVRVQPEGTVKLLDQAEKLVATFPVKMRSIYAHDSTTLTLGATGPLTPGPYTVRVNLSDAETGTTATAEKSGLEAAAAATPVPQQVVITTATATPKPAADNVQFAEVAATIVNNGEAITNAQLSLVASKDGAEVERFPISQSLSLPGGETPVTTRYIPAERWSSGSWTFELLVETVDPSGAAVVMARLPVDGTITIP